jgi:hypothetical protein
MAGEVDNIANLRAMRFGDQSAELAQIASARQALRVLDTAITATELRLRRLPTMVPGPGGGVGRSAMTAEQRLASRHAPRVGASSRTLIPLRKSLGRGGINLSAGLLKYGIGGASTVMPYHVVSGVGNQLQDWGDQMKEVQRAGGSQGEQAMVPVRAAGRTALDMLGVTSMSKMLMRPGLGKEGADKAVERTMESWFTSPSVLKQREQQRERNMQLAIAPIHKQYDDDNAFLDTWTPDDFDVLGDATRAQMKDEFVKRNRAYVNALYDLRVATAREKAAQNGAGD